MATVHLPAGSSQVTYWGFDLAREGSAVSGSAEMPSSILRKKEKAAG